MYHAARATTTGPLAHKQLPHAPHAPLPVAFCLPSLQRNTPSLHCCPFATSAATLQFTLPPSSSSKWDTRDGHTHNCGINRVRRYHTRVRHSLEGLPPSQHAATVDMYFVFSSTTMVILMHIKCLLESLAPSQHAPQLALRLINVKVAVAQVPAQGVVIRAGGGGTGGGEAGTQLGKRLRERGRGGGWVGERGCTRQFLGGVPFACGTVLWLRAVRRSSRWHRYRVSARPPPPLPLPVPPGPPRWPVPVPLIPLPPYGIVGLLSFAPEPPSLRTAPSTLPAPP